MNKQNKRKLYTFRHMWIRQALKPAMTLETKRSAMQITQNETQTTIYYEQKNLGLYLIDQYNPLDL